MKTPQYLSLFIRQLRPSQSRSSRPLGLLRPLSYRTHPLRNPLLAIAQTKCTLPLPTRKKSTAATPTTEADQNKPALGDPGEGHSIVPTRKVAFNAQKPNPESRSEPPSIKKYGGPPKYQLVFTCKPCGRRSAHQVSKQSYHQGTILITCPDCKNRHVISDHLQIFSDESITIEDLMREKGKLVKKGRITGQGNVEFWTDESEEWAFKTPEERREAALKSIGAYASGENK